MKLLGERIRELRKAKGLTQTELAGAELTKSMLSQIENGKAEPSMKTLRYLADQLGCEPGYFLEGEEADLAELVQTVRGLEKQKDYEAVYELLQNRAEVMRSMNVDAARLLEMLATACIRLNLEGAEEAVAGAVRIYERFSLYRESTQAKLRLDLKLVKEERFQEWHELLQEVRSYYEKHTVAQDILLELKIYYQEMLSLLAIGEYEAGQELLLRTLAFSEEHETYYRADDLYRIAAYHAIAYGDVEAYERYTTRSEQYAAFTDSKRSLGSLELVRAFYCNEVKRDHEQALRHLESYCRMLEPIDGLYQLEKVERGKALYHLGRIEEALESLQDIAIPEGMYHPLDHGWLRTAGAYRALCYEKLGQQSQAVKEIEQTLREVRKLPSSPYKAFIQETASRLGAQ
ncbi:helix-turn-helix domain-containing protein [Ectobacillus ponti]|nr:helix-turn-helix transcriptional regulator [Ectobacillus ponti]